MLQGRPALWALTEVNCAEQALRTAPQLACCHARQFVWSGAVASATPAGRHLAGGGLGAGRGGLLLCGQVAAGWFNANRGGLPGRRQLAAC